MLKMAHEGVFGDITNGHGGYLHDLRALLFSDTYYTDAWRRLWHTRRDASFYPMHGLAPIAACMDINRGDRMPTLAATSTAPKGLDDYRERFIPPDHPSWQETYVNGDLITCLIETHGGRIIRAEHDVSVAAALQPDQHPGRQPRHRRGLRAGRRRRGTDLRRAGPRRAHLARLHAVPRRVRPLALEEGRRRPRQPGRPRRHRLHPAVADRPADAGRPGAGHRRLRLRGLVLAGAAERGVAQARRSTGRRTGLHPRAVGRAPASASTRARPRCRRSPTRSGRRRNAAGRRR